MHHDTPALAGTGAHRAALERLARIAFSAAIVTANRSAVDAGDAFGDDLVAQHAQLVEQRPRRRRQVQAPGAAVGGIGAAFDQPGLGQPVDHAAQGDRLDLEIVGEPGLVDALVARQGEQHLPLRAADAERPCPRVEAPADQPAGVAERETQGNHVPCTADNKHACYMQDQYGGALTGAPGVISGTIACGTWPALRAAR